MFNWLNPANANANQEPKSKLPANPVKLIKDESGAPAVDLVKVESSGGIDLRKKTEQVTISLKKRGMPGIRAQVVLVLDHSGSMVADYRNHKVQNLVERFLAFGLSVDIDGTVPVIPFDSYTHSTTEVTLANYHNIVESAIWQPHNMGGTNLTSALETVREMAKLTKAPIFCAVVTDGEPNNPASATEIVCDLARYPVFIKFLAVKKVRYLEQLDDLPGSQRLLDNVDTKEYPGDVVTVPDEQFADDMTDEWQSWVTAALAAGVLLP